MTAWQIHQGDALELLAAMPEASVACIVTSPPYWGLRDYGVAGQIGLEPTLAEYVERMRELGAALRRVLAKDGSLWLNLGDSYSGSWGAQSRGDDHPGTLEGGSMSWARTIAAHPKGTNTGSAKRTGLKPKDLCGVPWRVAFALQDAGWWLREDVIWSKPNPMPEPIRDRCTRSHEYLFHLTRSARYYHDADAFTEPGTYDGPNGAQHSPYGQGFTRRTPEQEDARRTRHSGNKQRNVNTPAAPDDHRGRGFPWEGATRNKRSVWTIATAPFPEAHFATFPEALVEPCILASSRRGDLVLDPFAGSGTVGAVAKRLDRRFVGLDLNPAYCDMARRRIARAPHYQERIAFPSAAPAPTEGA